ncbi:MAG: hypothetical protein M3O03_05750 [Pseudomonadota bacterium]|nr:hypothetical protein [Pseudomonadota bacterium]
MRAASFLIYFDIFYKSGTDIKDFWPAKNAYQDALLFTQQVNALSQLRICTLPKMRQFEAQTPVQT